MMCHYLGQTASASFITEAPALLYYLYIPAIIVALSIGFFVFLRDKNALLNQLLLLLSIFFSGWISLTLFSMSDARSDLLLFVWPFSSIFTAIIAILSIYFISVFLHKQDVSAKVKGVFTLLLLPVFLLAHTDFNVSGFDISACHAYGFEGVWFDVYVTLLGVLATVWIFVLLLRKHKQTNKKNRKQIVLMGAAIKLFLFSSVTIIFFSAAVAKNDVITDFYFAFFGLFGASLALAFIGALVTKQPALTLGYQTIKLVVAGLFVSAISQFMYVENVSSAILTSAVLLLSGLAGATLLRSVRQEIIQKDKISKLVISLDKANVRLHEIDKQKSEFVTIASHQLRSPLTAIRGYASMLQEGSYGKLPKKAVEAVARISVSSRSMALGIEDYLNVSRIESGNMKYNLTDFNLKKEVEHICDDMRAEALKSGLVLLFRTDIKSRSIIHADLNKVVEIVQNLINNSIKYTQKGSIRVLVRDDVVRKRIYVDITDTGIGMSDIALKTIFQKFERGENANSINIEGTGLGLYVALKMTQAMKGTITAYSDGVGTGSRFTVELPLAL